MNRQRPVLGCLVPGLRVAAFGLLAAALLGCKGKGDATPVSVSRAEATAAAPLVEALQAQLGTLPHELRVSGVLRAQNQVQIRPEISAMVAEVLVKSGESVRKGQPLVRLQPAPQRQALRQGEATVRLAEAQGAAASARVAELEAQTLRTRKLADQAIVSALERETQDAQLAAANASVQQAAARVEEARAERGLRQSTLGKTTIRSPIDGRVGRRGAEVGMLVTPADVLFVVGDLDKVIVDVPLTEKMLGQLGGRTGQKVSIGGTALGEHVVQATLSRVSPFLAPGSFSTTGEIDLPNGDGRLLPGMFVTADIAVGQSDPATLVPVSALWEDPRTGLLAVFVVAPGQSPTRAVRLVNVQVHSEGRSSVAVGGVKPGEWVVTLGQHLLAAAEATHARVRPTSWQRVGELQSRQHEDLLAGYLEKQQRMARSLGATPPTTDSRALAPAPPAPAPR